MTTAVPPTIIDWVERLHATVDALAAPIAHGHGSRLKCKAGCHGCCSDGLSVFAIEAAVIERHHAQLLATGTAHGEGGCAFLDDGGHCRIYEHRPYVCRTQGLPLRWLEHDEKGEPVEVRDVCPLSVEGSPLEELAPDTCWTLGPIEERLAAQADGRRVALRALFHGERRHLPILP